MIDIEGGVAKIGPWVVLVMDTLISIVVDKKLAKIGCNDCYISSFLDTLEQLNTMSYIVAKLPFLNWLVHENIMSNHLDS